MATHTKSRPNKGELFITIDNIHYYTLLEGPEDAPVIILIHALMANHHMYDSIIPILHRSGYRTFRYDHPGHGQTPAPPQKSPRYTFDDFTKHTQLLYRTAVPSASEYPYAIIGCSIGGVLALRYKMIHIPTVPVQILSMAAPGYSTLPGSHDIWNARISQWENDGDNRNLTEATLKRWFPNVPEGFDWEKARGIVGSTTLEGYKICASAVMNYDYTGELAEVDGGDVMVLAGADDGNIGPKSILEDAAKVMGARYVLLKGVGHIPPMHTEVFVPVMMEFLGERK